MKMQKFLWRKKYCIVRDHCHYTGEYRCATHNICSLKYSVRQEIRTVFQNRSNYLLFYNKRASRSIWMKVELFRGKY